jgi:hypothetical protein
MKTLKILKHIDPKKYGLSNWKILEGKMFPLDKSIEGKFEWKLIEYTLDNVNIEGAKFLCPQGWELGRIEHLHSIDPKILLKEREGVEALKYALIMAMGSTEVGVGNSIEFPVLKYDFENYLLVYSLCAKKYEGRRNDFLLIVKKVA